MTPARVTSPLKALFPTHPTSRPPAACGSGLTSEQQAAAALGQAHGFEAVNDAGPGHQVRIGDVAPVRDLVDAARVLRHHGVADVSELAVLENEEVCEGLQVGDRAFMY
mgnify:CR=1 FL=1